MRSCKAKRKRGLFIMAKIDNHVSIRLLILLILLHLPSVICETPIYSDCDVDIYYNSISTSHATNEEIGRLLKSTHRRVLPYTGSAEDTWDALADLDTGSQYNTVRLIYTETQAIAFPSLGNAKTWNREHLWPKSLGVGYSGADFTDIHHLRPADINVNSARGNKHFSDCGVVSAMEYCRSPAHAEAAASTATDYDVWLPPKNVRGDIARALFYMEHRYFGDNGDPNLELTDCPTPDESDSTKLAYLSQLLQWHIEDPVDEAEATRNQRACERWQGNRNIFVDFPDLVNKIYGAPQFPIGSNGYQCSNSGGSTLPPTYLPSDSMNNCTNLKAGAVQVIGIHSDSPDEVALVALEDLPGGMELFLTDNAWTGSGFRGYEGTAKVRIHGILEDSKLFAYITLSLSSILHS
jgi:endonuclease I